MRINRLPNEWRFIAPGLRLFYARWDLHAPDLENEFPLQLRQKVSAALAGDEPNFRNASIPHLLSLIALKLQSANSDEVFEWYLTHAIPNPSRELSYPCIDHALANEVMLFAVRFLENILRLSGNLQNGEFTVHRIAAVFGEVSKAFENYLPTPSVLRLLIHAMERGIPVKRHSSLPSYQLGYGRKRKIIRNGYSDKTSQIATVITTHKHIAAQLLRENGLPAPRHILVSSSEEATSAADKLSFPLVVKPASTDKGVGVTVDVKTTAEIKLAYEDAARYGRVLIEEMVPGFDHRLHVINGKFIYSTRRMPPFVIGNGRDSIAGLIAGYALERSKDPFYRKYGSASASEPAVLQHLAKQNLALDAIPEAGRRIFLKSNSNVSTGGTHEDVTAQVHPDNIYLAERVARCVGLDNAGIDFITEDISKSWLDSSGKICEVNPTPGFAHELAYSAFLNYLFPDNGKGRIPIILMIGSAAQLHPYLQPASEALDNHCESWGYIAGKELRIISQGRSYRSAPADLDILANALLSDDSIDAALIQVEFSDLKIFKVDTAYFDLVLFCGDKPELDIAGKHAGLNLAPKENTIVNQGVDQFMSAFRKIFTSG